MVCEWTGGTPGFAPDLLNTTFTQLWQSDSARPLSLTLSPPRDLIYTILLTSSCVSLPRPTTPSVGKIVVYVQF